MNTPTPIRPCFHMKMLLSASCDQALNQAWQWFTDLHVRFCPRCAEALVALHELQQRLHSLVEPINPPAEEGLSPDRWAQLELAWAEAESSA